MFSQIPGKVQFRGCKIFHHVDVPLILKNKIKQ